MDTNTSPVAWICGTVLLLTILAGVFTLAWHGTIAGATVPEIIGPIIAGALTLLGIHVGTNATTKNTTANTRMLEAGKKGS